MEVTKKYQKQIKDIEEKIIKESKAKEDDFQMRLKEDQEKFEKKRERYVCPN